jgi:plastocyanin
MAMIDGAQWVKPGATLSLSAMPASNAVGAVTYTWAIGPLPGTLATSGAALDTGAIPPASTATLAFPSSGVWGIHCTPHNWMSENVTVVDGYAGPAQVDVNLVDGASNNDYRFVPNNVILPVGGKVVFHNLGSQTHTATKFTLEPPLKKLDVAGASGTAALDPALKGWQRVRLFAQDSEGRVGVSDATIYVGDMPSFAPQTIDLKWTVPVGGVPDQASQAAPPVTASFTPAYNGTMWLNFSVNDTVSGSPAPTDPAAPSVEIHVKQSGATQDTITVDNKQMGSYSAKVSPNGYDLAATLTQGANAEGKATIEIVYDLVPPAPVLV